MLSSASSPWTDFVSVDLRKTKNFWVGASSFGGRWGLFAPVPYVAGFFVLFSASSEYFNYRRLCLRNSFLDGGVIMMVLVVSAPEVLCLRSVVKSCMTSVYTTYTGLYSLYPTSNWWKVFLGSPCFRRWRPFQNFAEKRRSTSCWRAVAMCTPRTSSITASASEYYCTVFPYSNLRGTVTFDQSF